MLTLVFNFILGFFTFVMRAFVVEAFKPYNLAYRIL